MDDLEDLQQKTYGIQSGTGELNNESDEFDSKTHEELDSEESGEKDVTEFESPTMPQTPRFNLNISQEVIEYSFADKNNNSQSVSGSDEEKPQRNDAKSASDDSEMISTAWNNLLANVQIDLTLARCA